MGSPDVTPGTYVWTWGAGADQSFTLQIGSLGGPGVPDSGTTVSLLGCALLGLAVLRRKLCCSRGLHDMNTAPKFLFVLTAVAAFSIDYPASVQAVPTTYRYTGNPFTIATGPYTTSDFVTVMFTLAGPLAPNMPLTLITPLTYTLSDGVQTLTGDPQPFALFLVETGGGGNITHWWIFNITTTNASPFIESRNLAGRLILDFAGLSQIGATFGFNSNVPGIWTRAPSVADSGSTISIMTLTLTALGLLARRFQRAAG